MNDNVKITCYGKTETMNRRDAIAYYREGVTMCEGSEAERYAKILSQLLAGAKVCSDEEEDVNDNSI